MDDIVKQALLKWPNVPDCYGWLGLDARGNWYMRDDATQALGGFASGDARTKGSLLKHDKLIDFIGRNYACDGAGQCIFKMDHNVCLSSLSQRRGSGALVRMQRLQHIPAPLPASP